MDQLPERPKPYGYWADGSEGWGVDEMNAYVATVVEVSNEAWRRTMMAVIDAHVPEDQRSAAQERVGLVYGMHLQALRRARGHW